MAATTDIAERVEEMMIDRRLVAYHQAGHAVCAALLGFLFESVSIQPDATSNCGLIVDDSFKPEDTDEAWRWALVCHAGIAAEFLLTNAPDVFASDGHLEDFEQAFRSLKDGGYAGDDRYWADLQQELTNRAVKFLSEPVTWAEVEKLASALLDSETLHYEDAMNEMLDAKRLFEGITKQQ